MLFSDTEYLDRLTRCRALMHQQHLDALLVFEPENVTYLTGFFTEGYNTSFQFALITLDSDPVTVTRRAESYWLERTCAYTENAIYWLDGEAPADIVKAVLKETGVVSGRIGIEARSWRAPALLFREIVSHLSAATAIELGNEVSRLRQIKSEAEICLLRRAGKIADLMMETAIGAARPGVSERDLASRISREAILAGSDWAHPGCISSGVAAREIHANYSDRVFQNDDLVFAEVVPQVRGYHARFMRSIVIGRPSPGFVNLAEHLTEVQDRALAEVRAGRSCAAADRIYRSGILASGAVDTYPNKTFYGVGLLLLPNTLEPLEVTAGTNFEFQTGMTFHTYLAVDGFNLSETIVVTDTGFERLTNFTRDLIVV